MSDVCDLFHGCFVFPALNTVRVIERHMDGA